MTKSVHTPEYGVLCRELIALRNEAGLSQREVAKKLKVAPSWVAKVEGGERRLDLVEFCWICRALDIDATDAAANVIREMSRKSRKKHSS